MNNRELAVNYFAGGGGVAEGAKRAGIIFDINVNHDIDAIRMHMANHPLGKHFVEDVFRVNLLRETAGLPVGWFHASPDCTHFSVAKGGKPVSKEIRSLAWVVVNVAKTVRPRIITLENVKEFKTWGPLTKENKPDKRKLGQTFNLWRSQLENLGYKVEFRELSAADFGAPTIRRRLFMIARCDGEPIVWPAATHGPAGSGLKPYKTAAECIDWSIPCPSIFERKRPLAEKTMQRIARGIKKFVIEAKEPFLIGIDHKSSNSAQWPVSQPLKTITTENRFALIAPHLSSYHGLQGKETRGHELNKPLATQDTSNRFALVSAFLAKYYGGVTGAKVSNPLPTITAIDHNALVATHLTKLYGTATGADMRDPMPTITGQGQHIGEVRAFLIKYYGQGFGQELKEPLHTIVTKDRFGLVTIEGQDYQICDIGLRMLTPREIARAQGFYDSYILTGSKSNQVAKIGNSVSPYVIEAIAKANIKLRRIENVKVG
jgi:DNA (cytosine-5)-methyltransferase 1